MDAHLHAESLPVAPGTYCIWLSVEAPLRLPVGRLGELRLMPGIVGYVGSARGPGGLRARVGRHLRAEKPLRWHIDWLTTRIPVRAVWLRTGADHRECAWSAALQSLPGAQIPLRRFGASDCACAAHLIALPPSALAGAWAALAPDQALGAGFFAGLPDVER